MDNRERNWYEGEHGKHPDACQCVECVRERLSRFEEEVRIEEVALSRLRKRTPEEEEEYKSHCEGRRETLQVRGKKERPKASKLPLWLVGSGLSFLVLAGLLLLPWFGYKVFVLPDRSLWEPIALALGLAVWVVSIRSLRALRLVGTSFRSTVKMVVLIFLALVISSLVVVGIQGGLIDVTPLPLPPSSSGDTDAPSPDIEIPSPDIVDSINRHTGEYGDYYLGLVETPLALGGAGCYDDEGDFLVLINNDGAVDPSYSRLVDFLRQDDTDRFHYVYAYGIDYYYGSAESNVNLERVQDIIDGVVYPSGPKMCGDFAERLHNNAELAGIRCAYVDVGLAGSVGHACNAFQTTDRGLIYVDVTGWSASMLHPDRAVSTVSVVIGQSYTPVSLFRETGWSDSYVSMGTVTDFQVIWDGAWND